MRRKAGRRRMELTVTLAGSRRVAENLVLEVQALAQRFGLKVPEVTVTSRLRGGVKGTGASRRPGKPGSRGS